MIPSDETSSQSREHGTSISSTSSSANTDQGPNNPQLNFSRLAYNLPMFNETYEMIQEKSEASRKVIRAVRPTCSQDSLKRKVKSLFPISNWLGNYNWKNDLLIDIVTGITIAIFQVPQGLGYSLLAHVPVVYGLYSSFYPALIYSIFGSSNHCAVGNDAVVSLMTGSLVLKVIDDTGQSLARFHDQNLTSTVSPETSPYSKGEVALVVTFLVGIYQLAFSFLRLGFVSVYMSEQMISGFTTASAVYVFSSQIGYFLGIKLKNQSGPLSIFYTFSDLFRKLPHVNFTTLFVSLGCIAILLFFKLYLNDRLKSRFHCKIPFPIELLVVIGGTVLSHLMDLKSKDVIIVGTIPVGLPLPSALHWSLIAELWATCIPLAVVSYAVTYSIGKTFAAKHNYAIDSNQELLALGTANTVGCFFSCTPSGASLSRSAVQENAGGRTQMVSLVNCVGILAVLLYFGSLLEKLPNCVLSAIIIVALKNLLGQVSHFKHFWRVNKLDGSIWIVTFMAVIVLNIDIGLIIGVAYSLLTMLYKSQRPKTYLLGSVDKSDVYVPVRKYASAHELYGIKIYQWCGPLHFANVDYFKVDLVRCTGVSVLEVLKAKKRNEKIQNRRASLVEDVESGEGEKLGTFRRLRAKLYKNSDVIYEQDLPTHIIIDCSMFSYIDTAGVSALKSTVQEYESIGIKTFLANCAAHVVKMLDKDNFYKEVPPHHVYITIHDAVHHALDDQKELVPNMSLEENHNDIQAYKEQIESHRLDSA